MGADIHLVLEVKDKENNKWVGIDIFRWYHGGVVKPGSRFAELASHVARSRNYERFAALAGVRGDGPAPRGLPDDPSDLTGYLADEFGVDGHSHSWLPLEEAVQIFLATDANPGEMLLEEHPRTRDPYDWYFYLSRDEIDPGDYRLVFWFDN